MAEKKKVPALAIILAKAHKDRMAPKGPEHEDYEGSEEDDDSEGEMYMKAFLAAVHTHNIKEACEALEQWHEWAHRDMEQEEGEEPEHEGNPY